MSQALLLGAGFSVEFGMPLVWDLTRAMRKWLSPEKFIKLNAGWRMQKTGHSDKTQAIVTDILGCADLHYEQIIGAVEIAALRHENRAQFQELHGVRLWLLEVVYHMLQLQHANGEAFITRSVGLHRGFRALTSASSPLWVFSLNHDLMVEILAAELGIPLKNGFDDGDRIQLSTKASVQFQFSRLDMQKGSYPYQYFQGGQPGINILKIHGSLDIFGYDDPKSYLCLSPSSPKVTGYLGPLRMINEISPGDPAKVTNEIVLFDGKNETQFLRRSLLSGSLKFSRRISQVISENILTVFQSSLNSADELIVMGYGFGDHHINEIVRSWLEFASKRRIVIVDPRRDKIPDPLGHMPSQIKLEKKSAVEFLSGLPSGELTAAEKLELKLREQVRQKLRP